MSPDIIIFGLLVVGVLFFLANLFDGRNYDGWA
jgi:hypothetical protein